MLLRMTGQSPCDGREGREGGSSKQEIMGSDLGLLQGQVRGGQKWN